MCPLQKSQFFNFFCTRNLLTLNFILNFGQMTLNVLLLLKMSMTSFLMPLKFCICFTEQISSLNFQCVAGDSTYLVQQNDLMEVQDCSARCSKAPILANISASDISVARTIAT